MITVWCQIKISGIIISKDDKSPIPGAHVVEKGTPNRTVTSMDGAFTISVAEKNSILIFSSVGYISQELHLKGQDKIEIKLKSICYRDFFDHQRIGLYANSGIINNPVGGLFDLSFPAFFKSTTLKVGLGYQTNLDEKQFVDVQLGLYHLAVSCNFDADIRWYYRRVSRDNELNSKAYSIETNLNFSRLSVILGYSSIDLKKIEWAEKQSRQGSIIGIGFWPGGHLMIAGKASIYKDLVEYQGELSSRLKRINTFIKFYKVDSFTELSLGIGTEIGYRIKRRRK